MSHIESQFDDVYDSVIKTGVGEAALESVTSGFDVGRIAHGIHWQLKHVTGARYNVSFVEPKTGEAVRIRFQRIIQRVY